MIVHKTCQDTLPVQPKSEPHGSLSILKSCWISTWDILCLASDFKTVYLDRYSNKLIRYELYKLTGA